MSRSMSGWIIIIVILGVLVGVVGGGIMGGIVGLYAARINSPAIAAPVPQEIKAVLPAQNTTVQNMTVNLTSQLVETVAKAEPAVVTVVSNLGSGLGQFGDGFESSGSGVVISAEGHVITNNHVIEGANTVDVIFKDGTRSRAAIIGTDPLTDIAVLKVDPPVPAFLPFGDSNAVQLGEWVIAIGSPLGNYRGSVTVGVISGTNRRVGSFEGLIQTDAAINHGNSGGPLINLSGQIVGINTLVVRDTVAGAPAEGLGFAVPSNTVRTVAEQLIAQGRIDYPFIGITYTDVTPQIAAELNLSTKDGVIITQVTPGSPAAEAGLMPRDVVTAIDDAPINEQNSLRSILFKYRVGDRVTLTIVRDGETIKVPITLVRRPS